MEKFKKKIFKTILSFLGIRSLLVGNRRLDFIVHILLYTLPAAMKPIMMAINKYINYDYIIVLSLEVLFLEHCCGRCGFLSYL